MNKKALTETDIRSKFITPALVGANGDKWNLITQIREEVYFTRGRVIVRGKVVRRGEARKADYILSYKPNLPLAVIEAKDNTHAVGAGMQQALEYAEILDVPFAYSSNGDAFLEHDRTATSGTVTREIPLDQFPSPAELWSRYRAAKGFTPEQEVVATQDYYDDGTRRMPRYYQQIAINRTVDAIARGENRILLVMATGAGKTYTAFQIIWRLWKSGARKRILFLVDRNILADQTKTNDFKPFGTAMTKITNRTVDKSSDPSLRAQRSNPVTLLGFPTRHTRASKVAGLLRRYARNDEQHGLWTLYQAVTGTEEEQNIYKQFSPGFFDLVIIDECHRGSAADDAAWRKVLEYFSAATQIGLTATPKETKDVSNIEYFGDRIYTYSLRQGIADGFGFGVGLAMEQQMGWLALKRASAMPIGAYFAAKVAMAMLFVVVTTVLLGITAVVFGKAHLEPVQWLHLTVVLVLGAIPFCALGLLIGSVARAQAAVAIVNLIYLPMSALSGLWIPVKMFPTIMQDLAPQLPAYHFGVLALDAVGVPTGDVRLAFAAMIGFTVLFTGLAVLAQRRRWSP